MNAILHDRIAIAARSTLGEEAALCSGRYDNCVFHDLCFHQAEDLGAEIFPPIRPAQATPRNGTAAQVNAFNFRRVDKHFKGRFG